MSTLRPERVRFGGFEFDLSTGELRSIEAPDPSSPDSNSKVVLREQVFRVLQMLAEREGKIVTREEIKSRLWANDTFVDFDQSINATMKALRRALGDSADSPRYIETLGRRGYRLMLTIEYREAAPATSLETDPKQQERCAIEVVYGSSRKTTRKAQYIPTALLPKLPRLGLSPSLVALFSRTRLFKVSRAESKRRSDGSLRVDIRGGFRCATSIRFGFTLFPVSRGGANQFPELGFHPPKSSVFHGALLRQLRLLMPTVEC
jgi:DNA-binding winged helix-turn-helix (wHTH) protein